MVKSSFLMILMVLLFVATGYSAPFTAHGDGTVTDQDSELIWQQSDDDQARTWQAAIDYCSSYSPDGSSWRLPNKKELESIVDYTTYAPAINAVFTGANVSGYWSSTSDAGYPSFAWIVGFYDGQVNYYGKSRNYYARCVR